MTRQRAGLVALLAALLAAWWAVRRPTVAACRASASAAEEDCRSGPLAIHVDEILHDECRRVYDAEYAQCMGGK